jgi:hypothetical protein
MTYGAKSRLHLQIIFEAGDTGRSVSPLGRRSNMPPHVTLSLVGVLLYFYAHSVKARSRFSIR